MCLRGLHASTRIEATKTHTSLPTRKMDALSISGHALTMTPRLTCHAMRSWLGACRVHELLTRDENQRKKIHFAGFVKKWHASPRPRLANSAPWDSWPARPAARPRALYFQERGGLPQRCVKPTKTGSPARNYLPRLKKGVLVPAEL